MGRKSLKAADIKGMSQHRWHMIFSALAPSLMPAVKSIGKHVSCPVHGGSDGFRLFDDHRQRDGMGVCNTCTGGVLDGVGLLEWINGWSFRETLEAIDNFLNDEQLFFMQLKPTPPPKKTEETDYTKIKKRLDAQLKYASQKPKQAHSNYFINRGIQGASDFSSMSICYNNKIFIGKDISCPAIIALLTKADGELVGAHRILLTKDGNKLTELPNGEKIKPKRLEKIKETLKGGAIRFGDQTSPLLAVGEGLETMLAVRLMYKEKKPCKRVSFAATCTAALLENIEIPDHVEKLIIFADKDKSGAGKYSAEKLKERCEGKCKVTITYPELDIQEGQKGVDFLDAYAQRVDAP